MKIDPSTTQSPGSPVSAVDMATLGSWFQDKIISPEQLAFLAVQSTSGNHKATQALASVMELKSSVPADAFTAMINAVFIQQGFNNPSPTPPPPPPSAGPPAVSQEEVSQEEVSQEASKAVSQEAPTVKEICVLCIDVSGSMQTPFEGANYGDVQEKVRDRTRLEAVKQMFYGYRDATTTFVNRDNQACDGGDGGGGKVQHLLGLISYSDVISVHTAPTADLDIFEDVVDDMACTGRTNIYGAVAKACDILGPAAVQYPSADLRVLCLSDGQHNCHQNSAEQALSRLSAVGAVCDCLIVGPSADEDLRRLVAASEGECFQVDSVADAFETLESTSVVSLDARRNGAPRPERKERKERLAKRTVESTKAAPKQKGAMVAQPAYNPTLEGCTFMPLATFLSSQAARPVGAVPLSGSQRRLVKELRDASGVPGDGSTRSFFYYPGVSPDGSVSFVKVLMLLPPSARPYDNRVFQLTIQIGSEYPMRAPRVSFDTPIYHYAVSTQGSICLPALMDQWSPALTIESVLSELRDLVIQPQVVDKDASLSQRSWLSELLRCNPADYFSQATAHCDAHVKALPLPLQQRVQSSAVPLSESDLEPMLS